MELTTTDNVYLVPLQQSSLDCPLASPPGAPYDGDGLHVVEMARGLETEYSLWPAATRPASQGGEGGGQGRYFNYLLTTTPGTVQPGLSCIKFRQCMTFFQTPFCGRSGGRDLRVTIVHNVQCNITGVFFGFLYHYLWEHLTKSSI